MRDYGKVAPTFWTRGSGKRLRGDALGQALAQYLCNCPSSNMLGLFHVAIPTIAHEMGHPADDIRAALDRIETAGFALYDEEHDLVFVPNGAAFQIGETLKATDKRVEGVVRELRAYGSHPFVGLFLDVYAEAFCLNREAFEKGLGRALEAPSDRQKGAAARTRDSAPVPALASGSLEGGAGGDVPSGVHELAPSVRVARTDLGGLESETWAEGVSLATGAPCSPPSGGEVHAIRSALAAHCPKGLDAGARTEWLRDAARAFAAEHAGTKLDGWKFAAWLNSGRPARASPSNRPVQPVPETGRLWKVGKQ